MNKITIELCAEDRARLDKLNQLLEAQITSTLALVDVTNERIPAPVTLRTDDELTQKLQAVVDRAKNAPEEPEETPSPVTPKTEETPTETKEPRQTVTLAQIQQKVVQLAAGYGGTKKAKVREIINAYAKKVSDLPEDKWAEVWDKLTKLEKED